MIPHPVIPSIRIMEIQQGTDVIHAAVIRAHGFDRRFTVHRVARRAVRQRDTCHPELAVIIDDQTRRHATRLTFIQERDQFRIVVPV